jgi:hypothetical protein
MAPLFEIPVYRLSKAAWLDQTHRRIAKRKAMLQADGVIWGEGDPPRLDAFARLAEKVVPWHYNEVVGWVRLYWNGPGPVVKGYLHEVGALTLDGWRARKRFQRGYHPHPFVGGEPTNKALEIWLARDQTDGEIYHDLREALLGVVALTGDMPRRHIDLDAFDTVGPALRWRQVVGLAEHH